MTQFYKIAHLDEAKVAHIRELEKELDLHIMAFEPGLEIADLEEGQLEQIRSLEDELGVTLLVYQD